MYYFYGMIRGNELRRLSHNLKPSFGWDNMASLRENGLFTLCCILKRTIHLELSSGEMN